MNELLVMRHAKSDWSSYEADKNRPLNKRGQIDADRMGAWLHENSLVPDMLISPSSERTRETVKHLQHYFQLSEDRLIFDDELYLANINTLLQLIEEYTSSVEPGCQRMMILAHNPGIDHLVEYLADRDVPLTESHKLMTTAAVAHFQTSASRLKPGKVRLIQLVRPKELTD